MRIEKEEQDQKYASEEDIFSKIHEEQEAKEEMQRRGTLPKVSVFSEAMIKAWVSRAKSVLIARRQVSPILSSMI